MRSRAVVVVAACALLPACDRDPPPIGASPETAAAHADRAPPLPAPAAAPPAADPDPRARPARRAVTLVAGGDVIFHRRVVSAAAAHQAEGGFDWVLAGVRASLAESADAEDTIAVANLETPLTTEYVPPETGTPPLLGCPPDAAPALARAGFDVLFLANNHMWDQTSLGLRDTIRVVREAGMVGVGAGADEDEAYRFRIVERAGVRVAFVAFTHHVNGGPGQSPPAARVAKLRVPERVEPAIRAARAASDVVVVGVHWSQDFRDGPTIAQRRIAQQWVEWGADVIVGSGPHVLHDVERLPSPRGEAVVAYSLGNLLSNQGLRHRVGRRVNPALPPVFDPRSRDGLLLRVQIELAGAGAIRIAPLDGIAVWTENNQLAKDEGQESVDAIRIARLSDVDEITRNERLPVIQAEIGPAVSIR